LLTDRTSGKATAIYIPAYNAAKTLGGVIERIPDPIKERVAEIFVVDNASTDGTAEEVLSLRKRYGFDKLSLIRNETNLGYGGSQKVAYDYAISKGYEYVVMLHSDGQYAPEQLPEILAPLEANQADMVFGSRLTGRPLEGGMPLHRFLGNTALTGIANLTLGWKLSEFHSGYRAYRCAALSQIPYRLCADYYHFDVEILIQFKIGELRVMEIPIPTHYGDEENHINVWRTGLSILLTLGEYLCSKAGLRRIDKFNFKQMK
jgi:glycosyltransferase involved in cell wall biosynthesis